MADFSCDVIALGTGIAGMTKLNFVRCGYFRDTPICCNQSLDLMTKLSELIVSNNIVKTI